MDIAPKRDEFMPGKRDLDPIPVGGEKYYREYKNKAYNPRPYGREPYNDYRQPPRFEEPRHFDRYDFPPRMPPRDYERRSADRDDFERDGRSLHWSEFGVHPKTPMQRYDPFFEGGRNAKFKYKYPSDMERNPLPAEKGCCAHHHGVEPPREEIRKVDDDHK